jgi:hypothetical protein
VGYVGKQVFELSNHLGNVLATITDKKLQVSLNTTSTAYFEADVIMHSACKCPVEN